MKRSHYFIGVVAAAMVAAGATAYGVSKLAAPKQAGAVRTVEYVNNGVGTHFTSYDRENYPDLTYAAENAVQAVVNIIKTEEIPVQPYGGGSGGSGGFFEYFFGIPQQGGSGSQQEPRISESGGSGVIISPDGYIVTNNHVIENSRSNSTSKLRVTLNDNRTFEGRVIGTDPSTDIALIKIEAENLPTLVFGNSDALRLGEWVLAIGSPYGLSSTVTSGIVSAKARSLGVISNAQMGIESFIQTDAAVNPGNSGGPLVNVMGEIVGINTVIKSPTGSFTGYSFAVPSALVQKVIVDLKEYGVVQRALLGVSFQQINDGKIATGAREEKEVDEKSGLYVAELTVGGAAEAAGIKVGDIIIEVDGIPTNTSASLQEYIARHRPNDKVNISLKRDGKLKQFEVVLRNTAGKTELLPNDYVDPVQALGGTLENISDRDKRDNNISGGVKVRSVGDSGILRQANVRAGYIITEINGRKINSVDDVRRITEEITLIEGVYPGRGIATYSFAPRN